MRLESTTPNTPMFSQRNLRKQKRSDSKAMNSIISSIRFFPANYNRYEFNTDAIMDKQMVAKQGADQIPTAVSPEPIQSEYEKWLQNQVDVVANRIGQIPESECTSAVIRVAIQFGELQRRIYMGEQGYLQEEQDLMDEDVRRTNERPGSEG
jgi:hypothetical protein